MVINKLELEIVWRPAKTCWWSPCWASLVPVPSTSVGAQRRRQTDTPIFSVLARHTDVARPSLAAVSWTHRLHSWLCSSTDACMVWSHGTFPTTSSSLLILTAAVCGRRHPYAAGDPTYTVVHYRRPCVSGGRMPPLEQSAIRCHVSSNAHCFSESPQDTPLLQIISCITLNCFSVSYFLHRGQ